MRIVSFVAVSLFGGSVASADVWKDRVVYPDPDAPFALTSSSKVLYVNDCMPNGCDVTASSTDSSISNSSSIPDVNAHLDAYMHGTAHWDEVITCVKKKFEMFDIEVVTQDPGSAPHYEVMVGGTATQLQPGLDAGGIAPFISCDAARNNVLVFVFASQTSSKEYLCTAIAHEAGHAYGLSHSLDPLDPMTYMDLSSPKQWQNSEFQCGTSSPQPCRCSSGTQNQFRTLNDTWGLASNIVTPKLTLSPRDGQWVKPNFPISAVMDSQLAQLEGSLTIDGEQVETFERGLLAFNAPELPAGDHSVSLSVTDFGDRTASASASVHVMSACSAATACPSGFNCLGGFCLPGRDVAGGLGATCSENGECSTNTCSTDGTDSFCTAVCDAGNSCPSGFTCLADANVCWPDGSDGGGCASTGGGGSGIALLGLGALVLAIRRRPRTAR